MDKILNVGSVRARKRLDLVEEIQQEKCFISAVTITKPKFNFSIYSRGGLICTASLKLN